MSSIRLPASSFSRSKACPVPRYRAGIHALSHRVRTSIAIPPPTSAPQRRPHFVLPAPISSLARKHVPDSDPGCALQSPSMPALRRRNVPNCRPMVDGGMRKCSAVEDFARRGACPPLGSGWGVAESTVPIRGTKPQLRLFIPWVPAPAGMGDWPACVPAPAGMGDCYESMPRTPIRGRNPEGWGMGPIALGLVPSHGRPGHNRPGPSPQPAGDSPNA